jgi:hypothetical protein
LANYGRIAAKHASPQAIADYHSLEKTLPVIRRQKDSAPGGFYSQQAEIIAANA